MNQPTTTTTTSTSTPIVAFNRIDALRQAYNTIAYQVRPSFSDLHPNASFDDWSTKTTTGIIWSGLLELSLDLLDQLDREVNV